MSLTIVRGVVGTGKSEVALMLSEEIRSHGHDTLRLSTDLIRRRTLDDQVEGAAFNNSDAFNKRRNFVYDLGYACCVRRGTPLVVARRLIKEFAVPLTDAEKRKVRETLEWVYDAAPSQVVFDATFSAPHQLERFGSLGDPYAPVFQVVAPDALIRTRLAARSGNESAADIKVYEGMKHAYRNAVALGVHHHLVRNDVPALEHLRVRVHDVFQRALACRSCLETYK